MKTAIILATATCFYFLVDRVIFSNYRAHIDLGLLHMVFNSAVTEIFDFTWSEYTTLCMLFFFLLILQYSFYIVMQQYNVHRFPRLIFTVLFLLLLGVQGGYLWAVTVGDAAVLLAAGWVPGFFSNTFKTEHSAPIKLNYPLNDLSFNLSVAPHPNILIITIDSWRYDNLDVHTTPFAFAFSQKSTRYANHYSGGNGTLPGVFSLFYSANPDDFAAFDAAAKGPVLFDALYKNGYEVGAYTSASAMYPPFYRTVFLHVKNFEATVAGQTSVERDINITEKTKALMDKAHQLGKPYFAFVFYDSAHAYNYPKAHFAPPFLPSAKVNRFYFLTKMQQQEQLMRHQYRNALYFIDGLIGDLLLKLKQDGTLENTLVILTSDHGEEFNDNNLGYWGHTSNFMPAQTHVPFVVHWPHQSGSNQVNYYTSHYDLVPTIASHFLGVMNKVADYSLGIDLDSSEKREVILIGSYKRLAFFVPTLQLVAITDALGGFQVKNFKDQSFDLTAIATLYFKIAQDQINHFHSEASSKALIKKRDSSTN